MPYSLHPTLQAFVEHSEAFTPANPGLAAQRQAYLAMAAHFTPAVPAGLGETDLQPPGCAPLRLYQPQGPQPAAGWPAVLYLHGGGWCVGNLDSHNFICRAMAVALRAQVLAVDYRLAPEHPYPAALLDALAAWHWLREQPGTDRQRLLVAGDSAGATLAAGLCLALARQAGPQPRGQALVYPLLGPGGTPSYAEHAEAPLLAAADVRQYLNAYLPAQAWADPLALPLLATELHGTAPAFIATAEYDPLRDDGALYARQLAAAGTAVEYLEAKGWLHGGLRALASPATEQVLQAWFGWMAGRL